MGKKFEGSLTVEAAIIFPLVLMLFVSAINGGIGLYQVVSELSVKIESDEKIDTVKIFYRFKMLGELFDNEN